MIEMNYKGYFITGNNIIGYIAVSPYGKYSPKVYRSIIEAKAAIVQDLSVKEVLK